MMFVAFAALAAWAWLGFRHRGFWRAEPRLGTVSRTARSVAPAVSVVIPARDEAATIGDVVRAHLMCDYQGKTDVIVVDDASTDGTAEAAREQAGAIDDRRRAKRSLLVIDAPPLAEGWSGKLNAVAAGVARARTDAQAPCAKYLLLCDADILMSPTTLSLLVSRAEADDLALTSLLARLDSRGPWASLLIPSFVYFFQKLYPFNAVNDPALRIAGAAGGCMLVRADALAAAGGIEAIRGRLIDDCALAAILKNGPGGPRRIWLGHAGEAAISLRDNRSLGSIWAMVARTAFAQLERSWLRLAVCVAGMAIVYLAPPAASLFGLAAGNPATFLAGAAAWGLMAWTFAPTLRSYRKPVWLAPMLPLAGALYTAMTISSALANARGVGGQWKGRTYKKG